jgi:lysophospholipase L1-like esterase
MLDIIFNSPNMKELMVSELDDHPNEKGHKVLADELIKRIEKHGINNI